MESLRYKGKNVLWVKQIVGAKGLSWPTFECQAGGPLSLLLLSAGHVWVLSVHKYRHLQRQARAKNRMEVRKPSFKSQLFLAGSETLDKSLDLSIFRFITDW